MPEYVDLTLANINHAANNTKKPCIEKCRVSQAKQRLT